MGCAGGKANVSARTLKISRIGLPSVDNFTDECNNLIERFSTVIDDIERKREAFERAVGFHGHYSKGARAKHVVIGILLSACAVANGDLSKIKVEAIKKKPYAKIKLQNLNSGDVEKWIKAFEDYIDEFADAVETLPKFVEDILAIAARA